MKPRSNTSSRKRSPRRSIDKELVEGLSSILEAEHGDDTYAIVIQKFGELYYAHVPDLPGCSALSRKRNEIPIAIIDSIRKYMTLVQTIGETVPAPATKVLYAKVDRSKGADGVKGKLLPAVKHRKASLSTLPKIGTSELLSVLKRSSQYARKNPAIPTDWDAFEEKIFGKNVAKLGKEKSRKK